CPLLSPSSARRWPRFSGRPTPLRATRWSGTGSGARTREGSTRCRTRSRTTKELRNARNEEARTLGEEAEDVRGAPRQGDEQGTRREDQQRPSEQAEEGKVAAEAHPRRAAAHIASILPVITVLTRMPAAPG